MIVITSLSPKHTNKGVQQDCINAWKKYTDKVISVNAKSEVKELHYSGVEIIETDQVLNRNNKTYVYLREILTIAKRECLKYGLETIVLTNSDIKPVMSLERLAELCKHAVNGIVYLNRWEYTDIEQNCQRDNRGYDVFIFNIKHIDKFIYNPFVLGLTHFDFWIPYKAQKDGLSMYNSFNVDVLHKRHKTQYDNRDWIFTGDMLMEHEGLFQFKGKTRSLSDHVQNIITNNSIAI